MRSTRKKLIDSFYYRLERFVLSGTPGRLALMTGIVILLSLSAGFAAMWADPAFKNPAEAIWWAFLRLTDPGYLGDDQGNAKRAISTGLTILGLVVFVGGLVAIVTQWLNETVRKLEMGLTPVSMEGHVVLLGWTDRTVGIVRELVRSQDRARQLIRFKKRKHLSIVVLAEELDASLLHEFRTQLGEDWDNSLITLRSGTPLRNEHLERVDFLRAAVIVLPGADFAEGGPDALDTRTIKTILSINQATASVEDRDDLPLLIAEIHDSSKVSLARRAYRGEIELLASDRTTACLIAQNTRHEGLSFIYRELLDQDGNELYIRKCPELLDKPFHTVGAYFPWAIPIGVVYREGELWRSHLCPKFDYVLQKRDHLVFLCENLQNSEPVLTDVTPYPELEKPKSYEEEEPKIRRILVLGWRHMLPALLDELDGFAFQHHEVTILTAVPLEKREREFQTFGLELERVTLEHIDGDYTMMADLERTDLESFDQVIMLASEWVGTSEESDARTIVGYLLLRERLEALSHHPKIIVELTDESNQSLLTGDNTEIIISAELEGHMLAQVTLRPELRAVFDTLFGSRPPMFDFRPAASYPEVVGEELEFEALQKIARQYEEIAIGVRVEPVEGDDQETNGGVILNPDKHSTWKLTKKDDLIVLMRRE